MAGESGIITVTTSGTPVSGPSNDPIGGEVFMFTAHPDNTDLVWIGPKAQGFPLRAASGGAIVFRDITTMIFDADVNGEKICWLCVR